MFRTAVDPPVVRSAFLGSRQVPVEARAVGLPDAALRPEDPESRPLEVAREALIGRNPDLLRVRPPPQRARSPAALAGALQATVERLDEAGADALFADAEGLSRMLETLRTLARIDTEIAEARGRRR